MLFPALLAALVVPAQDSITPQLRPYVRVAAPVVALTHVRVIDGTGEPARPDQTVILRNGRIDAVGDAARTPTPSDALVLDLEGRTVLPGLVMLHEHFFYPVGSAYYNWLGYSFPRLYLAGGVTTARTGGSMVPYADLNLRRDIETGRAPGPDLDVTGPYLNGPGLGIAGVKALRGPEDARRMVEYWADEGVTSFKAYMHISRADLAAVIETAHRRGLKVTGHLCSVTFREAADLGIDDLEHGLFASTDFAPNKEPDRCPAAGRGGLPDVDIAGEPVQRLIRALVERRVAITSTLPVLETLTPGRPRASDKVLDVMLPEARDQYLRQFGTIAVDTSTARRRLFATAMAFELAFARAGGLLVAGTDPTGYGGVVAGFANHREIELLVEAGFTPVEAIRIATLNGAIYLGRDHEIGSIIPGKRADLVVVRGDPSSRIADIESVELVFKRGLGYDPERLIAAARGLVGLR
jgi:imidazolonepropionase-like amidohydrolase